jgi:hypothetical protein
LGVGVGRGWREVETIRTREWPGNHPRVYMMWTDRREDECILGNPVVGWYGFPGDTTGDLDLVVHEVAEGG